MGFRVLIAGGRGREEYARLRDVEIVTAGDRALPALAASYARSRGLPVTVVRPTKRESPTE